jgi:hypothetical protein
MFPILERASRNDLITHLSQRGFCTNCTWLVVQRYVRRYDASNQVNFLVMPIGTSEKIRAASGRHAAASAQAGVLSIHRN